MHSEIFAYFDPSPRPRVHAGTLLGKRAAVQCAISVRGWPVEAGSRALQGFVALEDATVVERIKAAGAALIGNTHSSELGFGLLGDSTGQALKDGHSDIALMTDTMGEARVAAARAGMLGFKPSYGRISRFGLVGLVPSMDCCGILGHSLEDIEAVFHAVRGRDERDPSMGDPALPASPKRKASDLCVGFAPQAVTVLEPDERLAFERVIGKMREAGIEIREIQWKDFDLFVTAHNLIGSVEASSSCGKYDGVRYGHCATGCRNWNEMYLRSRAESFSPVLKAYLFQGAYFQFENYPAFVKACRVRARLIEESRKIMGTLDLFVSPTRRRSRDIARADSVEQVYEDFSLTLPANVTGQPALTLPGLVKTEGGDLGVQMIGAHFGDENLLEVAGKLSLFA